MELRGAVVVITGASSGIGRQAARRFAARGADVVLAGRRSHALDQVASECRVEGVRALTVPTDVADEGQVHTLAQRAVDELGGFDVWVNNAGIYALGRFEETPPDVFRRVLEVNFFGAVYGSRAAIAHFRERGRGVLVNNTSLAAAIAYPNVSAYSASKAALGAFGQVLRLELRDEPHIHVCTVRPASIDTPLFQHAANFRGRRAKPLSPVHSVDAAAEAVVRAAERPRREIIAGRVGKLIDLQHRLLPGPFERIFAAQADRDHFTSEPQPPTPGNAWEPLGPDGASGGWHGPGARARHTAAVAAALAVPAAVGAVLLRR